MKNYLTTLLLISCSYVGRGQQSAGTIPNYGESGTINRVSSHMIDYQDTVKAVMLVYQPGPTPLQKRVWAVRAAVKYWNLNLTPRYNEAVGMLEGTYQMQTLGYLDTDRHTPLTFEHVWETAVINW